MGVIATAIAVLDLLTMWRILVCFVPCGGAAIWLLFNLDRPSNVVSFIALLAAGVALGALWQWRHARHRVKRS
jgi:hypothetical protein